MIFFVTNTLTTAGTSLRSEPKHIVFLSQLLLLFNFCHVCKTDNPSIEERQIGTKAVVTSTCHNPKCPKQVNTSHSQPNMPNSGIAAGNFLLCMAVLLAGGSATKVFRIFSHMGLGCVSLNTFFKFQRVSLFQCSSRVPVNCRQWYKWILWYSLTKVQISSTLRM